MSVMSPVEKMSRAATIALGALDTCDPAALTAISKASVLAEEYAHFRSCGVSRALTLTHLAGVYDTTPAYAARICKENHQ